MKKMKSLFLLLLCSTTLFAYDNGNSLFQIDDEWITHNGKRFHLSNLRGKPTLLAMIYTNCKDVCPITITDMKKIEKLLPSPLLNKTQFVLLSLDSERDTTEKLKAFAESHAINSSHWLLLRSNPSAVRTLAVALGMKYKKEKSGDFQHSNLITVLDENGVIKHQQTSLGQGGEETVSIIKSTLQ